ncbi:Fur family transcriptional regulator [Stieleria varia]|nr:Fur family transcriptional regulator [Stieleria varia]
MQQGPDLLSDSSPVRSRAVSTASPNGQDSLTPIKVSLTPQQRFEEYLQSRGLRQTNQRKFLIDRVFSHHEHFDADELIERLPRRGQENYVSSATVYRTLREFVDAGLLNSFQLDGRTVYEHGYGYPQHDHLYCTSCRELFEFQSDDLLELRNEVAAQRGFRVNSHRMIIQGVCQKCSKKRRKKRKQDLV